MSLAIVIDMNLSPDWVDVLAQHGWQAIHWSSVGSAKSRDREIMEWAKDNGHIVFTHDLDFGTILAATKADAPSVLQVRARNILPDFLQNVVAAALKQHQAELEVGALVVVDPARARVVLLPL